MAESTPQITPDSPESSDQHELPFVTIRILADGNYQCQTNLKDKALILGLIEFGKFLMMSAPDQPRLHEPGNGFIDSMRRAIRR